MFRKVHAFGKYKGSQIQTSPKRDLKLYHIGLYHEDIHIEWGIKIPCLIFAVSGKDKQSGRASKRQIMFGILILGRKCPKK